MKPPSWRDTGSGMIADDPVEHGFALRCRIIGFDLPNFDMWLETLGPCAAKDEMIQRRAMAKAADSTERLRWHVEFLHMVRRHIANDEFLRPKARNYSNHQSKIARRDRASAEVAAIIDRLAAHDEPAAALWTAFYGGLDAADMYPELKEDGLDIKKWSITYFPTHDPGDAARTMTYGTFENRLRDAKKKKKSR